VSVASIDHIALPTSDAERLVAFYQKLGFGTEQLEDWRAGRYPIFSITCGDNKINIHPEQLAALRDRPEYLRGPTAEAGCGDVCFVWQGGVAALEDRLARAEVAVITGPVLRVGGRAAGGSKGISLYVRDPDQNLVEFISYDPEDLARYAGDGGDCYPASLPGLVACAPAQRLSVSATPVDSRYGLAPRNRCRTHFETHSSLAFECCLVLGDSAAIALWIEMRPTGQA
jgi:catechol 2,3-dioxygenase-like lactoylglutathione lyase family enzyme